MKKYLFGIFFLILCFSVNFSASWAQKPSGPKMVLKEKTFDFKEVEQGKALEHNFKVLNVGDQPLEIKKVKPG